MLREWLRTWTERQWIGHEGQRRLAILEGDRRLKAAMDSDALDERDVEALTQFVHGARNAVTFFGKIFEA